MKWAPWHGRRKKKTNAFSTALALTYGNGTGRHRVASLVV